jgi:hypothetical protein
VVGYSVKEGYRALLMQTTLPTKYTMWRNIWNNDGLPKINIFCWILAQGKLLTGENLIKRGFQGPFCCALCKKNLETTQHLFLDCEFSKQVWKTVYEELFHKIAWPSNCKTLLGKWGTSIRDPFMESLCFKECGRPLLNMCVGKFGSPETELFSKISVQLQALWHCIPWD